MKKKKKVSLKNIEKAFRALCKGIADLSTKVKIVIGVWAAIFILIIVLIIVGSSNKKYLEEYKAIEDSITEATERYIKSTGADGIYGLEDSPNKVPIEVLVNQAGLDDTEIKNKKCEGFSLSYYDDKKDTNVINSYITCKDYTTKGYDNAK